MFLLILASLDRNELKLALLLELLLVNPFESTREDEDDEEDIDDVTSGSRIAPIVVVVVVVRVRLRLPLLETETT